MINLFTIGFTKKSAEQFFNLLTENGVTRIVDTRLNHSSQLSGFAKSNDLKFFCKRIAGIDYIHIPEFAPTAEILDQYRKKLISWEEYEKEYTNLLVSRDIINLYDYRDFHNNCILCSEDTPDKCHRRLLAEYLQKIYEDIRAVHLV